MSDRLLPQRWTDSAPAFPGLEAPSDSRSDQESVLKVVLEFLSLVRRNWKVVLGATLGSLAIVFVQLQFDHPLFRAKAVIRFEDKGRALSGGLGGSGAQRLGGPVTDPLLTQIQMLQSRAVARIVVEREGLRVQADKPGLPGGWMQNVSIASPTLQGKIDLNFVHDSVIAHMGGAVATARYGEPVRIAGTEFTVLRRPREDNVVLSIAPLERAVDGLLVRLHGRDRERTDIIDVTYENASPTVAQAVANTAVEVFQAMNAQASKQVSVRRRQFIEEQLHKTETLLSEAQASHNRFRTSHQVYSSQEKFRSQQADLSGIELRRRELQADQQINQSLLEVLNDPRRKDVAGERLGALVSSPGIASNAVVVQLFGQLTRFQSAHDSLTTGAWSASSENPDVKRLEAMIASTEANIAAAVKGQIAGIAARIAALDELQRRSAGQMAVLPTTEAAEGGLLAQVGTFRKEAERLREELQKAQIEEAAEGGQIDIVDLATLPAKPMGTGGLPRLAFALVIGLALGALFSYILENYTSVLRRREEVERISNMPTLAVVPPLVMSSGRGNRLLDWVHPTAKQNENGNGTSYSTELATMVDARSHAAEAFRTLRTNLLFSAAVQSMRELVITSAGPSDGKSTTAANLAVAFAQQGQRVLLIDCDLRKPRIHQLFGHAQIPGLTNALLGGISVTELVRPTSIEGLSVLTAGPTPPNPAELLGGARMRALLDNLAQSFDLLIIDTPPVLIVSDAAILSRHAGGATLLVVRAGKTQAAALRDAMQQLANVGTRVIGTVLNDPDGEVAKFSSYYGYYYADYYSSPVTA